MNIATIIVIAVGVIFLGVSIWAEYRPTKEDENKEDK